jgi:hypothetical protein
VRSLPFTALWGRRSVTLGPPSPSGLDGHFRRIASSSLNSRQRPQAGRNQSRLNMSLIDHSRAWEALEDDPKNELSTPSSRLERLTTGPYISVDPL